MATIRGTNKKDKLKGTSGPDKLFGLGGNDILDGKKGADKMIGGKGNDTYLVDHTGDKAIEKAGQGTDTVRSKVTFTLGANVENLTLLGTAAINGTGNELANTIIGNAGNNILDGGDGSDSLIGGLGDDTLVVGLDADGLDTDTLDGGDGSDSLMFATGNPFSFLDFTLAEGGSGSFDGTGHGLADADYTGIENLVGRDGTDTIDQLTGNSSANRILGRGGTDALHGMAGNDILEGGDGDDSLDGGEGSDILNGGNGDDFFAPEADASGLAVDTIDGGEGSDLLSFQTLDLTPAVLTLDLGATGSGYFDGRPFGLSQINFTSIESVIGTSGEDHITGSDAANSLYGSNGNDILDGGAGDDFLRGGFGSDTLTGGSGADDFALEYYEFTPEFDLIEDFTKGSDQLYINPAMLNISSLTEDVNLFNNVGGFPSNGILGTTGPHLIMSLDAFGGQTWVFYDSDGEDGAAAVLIAKLDGISMTPFAASDFTFGFS